MNNYSSLKKTISHNLQCVLGSRVSKKIVVIESDDWGSIRMSSKNAYDSLNKKIDGLGNSAYNKYDSLASEEDLEMLFEVLSRHSGSDGNSPVITANTIMTNPVFDRIREEGYQTYHYELFTETFKRYSNHNNSLKLWKEGMESNIFQPQLHGREHLNFKRWLKLLNTKDQNIINAFNYEVFGVPLSKKTKMYHNVMGAFDMDEAADRELHKKTVKEAALLFKKVFGFTSKTFIAPNYIWHSDVEKALLESGVTSIQGGLFQFIPKEGTNSYHRKFHYTGQMNKFGQRYIVRNCFFEPSLNQGYNWVDDCLNRVKIAFNWNKPAIICSHRVNYIGGISSSNRDNSLAQLDQLLGEIIAKWPEAIFVSSDQLENYYN